MKKIILTLSIAALAFSVQAEEAKKGGGGFAKLDADKSGDLTIEEYSAGKDAEKAKKSFAKIDADSDGKITKDEMKARSEKVKAAKAKKKEAAAAE